MTPALSEQGQISIFFSASMVVMITIVAFVINIGLFVKAKINLQNATDAAAYAGASVQARQLTKIAYLNWEMRNIYKEWLYKYYVIGNLNIKDVENPVGSGTMKFKLEKDVNVLNPSKNQDDPFNIPAVCIHIANSQTNICKRYAVPGLPEFGSSNLPGAEEASRAFMDTLISTKVNDCIDRTRLNMMVANTWTYNVLSQNMDESLVGRGPAILSNRQGAWPRAVELAMRIRNLEFVMNRPAETSKLCYSGSTKTTNCSKSITEIEQERKLGNERIVKAFYSGYRNLGNDMDNEMKQSFTLTELGPKKVKYDSDADASNLLVPASRLAEWQKQWVDLKLMMVNYAIFYAAMIPRAEQDTSGACDVTKVAIPVPGYPLGFYKNPDVLTYYAVKGEAEFTGMFNPFQEDEVKMEAYAAAKPMGGRIGPMLFTQKPNEGYIIGRTDAQKFRSIPYMTSYDFRGVTVRGDTYAEPSVPFVPGLPLPTNSTQPPGSFWVQNPSNPVGGKLTDTTGVQFGVPNLVYDYEDPFRPTGYTLANQQIHMIKAADTSTEEPVGLFAKYQFRKFKGSFPSNNIAPQVLEDEIARVRAPTLYEAANYLIPTPNSDFNLNKELDSFGFISSDKQPVLSTNNGYQTYEASIYAPLFKNNDQTDVLYSNSTEVLNAIFDYMRTQQSGMEKYKMSMNRAAINIWTQRNNVAGGAEGSRAGYERAARGVSDITFAGVPDITQKPGSCSSLAGQFLYFYFGGNVEPSLAPDTSPDCPKPLGILLEEYFAGTTKDSGYDPTYYTMSYSYNPGEDNMKFLTAYLPGPFTGSQPDGTFNSPISGGISDKMRRNSYSTKFISLDSVQSVGDASYNNKQFAIHSEGQVNESGNRNTSQTSFANTLETSEDLSSIKY